MFPSEGAFATSAENSAQTQAIYDGMTALDIHFELDGEEAEPIEAVYVCINAMALLPETAVPASMEICHIKEPQDATAASNTSLVADNPHERYQDQ